MNFSMIASLWREPAISTGKHVFPADKITNVNLKENTVTLEYRASSRYRSKSNNTGPGYKTVAIPFAYLQSLSQMKGATNANGAETLRDKINILVDHDAETTGKIKELAKKF